MSRRYFIFLVTLVVILIIVLPGNIKPLQERIYPENESTLKEGITTIWKDIAQDNTERSNGAVINIWIDDISRIDRLRDNSIKYLVVDVGDTEKDGRLLTKEEDIIYFLDLISLYEKEKNYSFIMLPYSEIDTYDYDFTSQEFKENFIREYSNLVALGFDGVYVDIEPIQFSQRDEYIYFLQGLNSIFNNSIIAVYAGHLGDSHENEWEWNVEFYSNVSSLVDIMVVPGYDLSSDTGASYMNNIRNKIYNLNNIEISSQLILAVPTHKPAIEIIENALKAYADESKRNQDSQFTGVVIFAEWTTDENEWNVFSIMKDSL